jgi:hypothetical protein
MDICSRCTGKDKVYVTKPIRLHSLKERIINFHATWSHMQPVNVLFIENEHSMKTSLKDVTGM